MNFDDPIALKESLNRAAKVDVDSGSVPDFEQAVRRLQGHRVQICVGPEVSQSPGHQAALLTVVNIARRFALGGVWVDGPLDGTVCAGPIPGVSLKAAVCELGGIAGRQESGLPTIVIGSAETIDGHAVAATFAGWRGGVVRLNSNRLKETTTVLPAAVLAGALAAGEVFSMLRGNVEAGRRSIGLSLWRPDGSVDWKSAVSDGPELSVLPDQLWLLGLGHLGQAFLWALMLCDFARPDKVRLTIQDMDRVSESTESTSILTWPGKAGRFKTRDVAETLQLRGFGTTIIERPFDGRFSYDPTMDPAVLVCGVDNALARSRLEAPGFPFIVEGGIGHTATDYSALRVHTFPSPGKDAATLWGNRQNPRPVSIDNPAYGRLSANGRIACGLAQLAETAVGVPFVGAVGGTLMLAQILRLLSGDSPDMLVDLDLRSPKGRRAFVNSRSLAVVPSFQPRY